MQEVKTKTTTRFWVVCQGDYITYTSSYDNEQAARDRAARLKAAGVDVARIEQVTMVTVTTTICEF